MVCGDEVARPKPYPDGVIKILETLLIKPEELYIWEILLGCRSQKSAGVRLLYSLGLSPREEEEEKEVEWVFRSPEELWEWVQKVYN